MVQDGDINVNTCGTYYDDPTSYFGLDTTVSIFERVNGPTSFTSIDLADFILVNFNDDNGGDCYYSYYLGGSFLDSFLDTPVMANIQYVIVVVRAPFCL